MHEKILQIVKDRDNAFINEYCQVGTFMDEKGFLIGGVCRQVSAQEMLNFMHITQSLIFEELKIEKQV